jgi:proteasome lid subunit RPN8/RPN11
MLQVPPGILAQIQAHGESAYPHEGAGFLLGEDGDPRKVLGILPLSNAREEAARHDRYLISPLDYLGAEQQAESLGLSLVGVFHSHPDHPNQPSEYDREWAQPYFSYLITTVSSGRARESRSWRLAEDRSKFEEEAIETIQ